VNLIILNFYHFTITNQKVLFSILNLNINKYKHEFGHNLLFTKFHIGEEIKAIPRRKIVMKEESCKVLKKTMIRKGNNAEKLKRKASP